MEENLFKKYSQLLQKKKNDREEIISLIQEKTDILLTENEIVIKGKKVSLLISSVKRAALTRHNLRGILLSKGFTLI